MKAAQINEYGDSSVIHIVDTEKPSVSKDQVLVEVHASSLNPVDSSIRAGVFKDMIPLQFPVTLGGDLAGVITEVGDGVEGFVVGDKVYGQSLVINGTSGALAEFATAKAGKIAKMPANLDFQQAASLPLAASSAVQALLYHAKLQAGQKVFIHGGSGGIGSIAIQVAKAQGAYVATTATGRGIDLVKQLGADEVIDYKVEGFTTRLHDFDVVLNNAPNEFDKTLRVLKPGGIGVSLTGPADEALAEQLDVTAIYQSSSVTNEILNTLTEMVESGKIVPQVAKVYPLNDVAKAFDERENGSVLGKIVIAIR